MSSFNHYLKTHLRSAGPGIVVPVAIKCMCLDMSRFDLDVTLACLEGCDKCSLGSNCVLHARPVSLG